MYLIYTLYLINTAITYLFFSYPQTVLNANQKQYIVNRNESIFVVISAVIEIFSLILTHNYVCYLITKIGVVVLKNIVLAVKAIKLYPYIIQKDGGRISKDEIHNMFKDVYAIFVVKLSSQLFNSTDNLFISAMFGTILAGYNSNYLIIINAVYGILSTLIYSFGGSIGNLYATETKKRTEEVFSILNFINQWIACLCTAGLFHLLNPLIILFWGEKYIFSMTSVALMCVSFYIVSSLYALFNFRQSMGLFRFCIYSQLIAAIINIILDFILGKLIGLNGLFLATIIANLGVAVFPYAINLYKEGFDMPYMPYIYKIVKGYFLCGVICFITYFICKEFPITVWGFIGRGATVFLVTNAFLLCVYAKSNELKSVVRYLKKI